MIKLRTIAGVVCALAVALLAVPPGAMADGEGNGPVGSYLFKFLGVQQLFGRGSFVPGLATLNADGTLTSVTGSDEAGPSSLFLVKNSAVHGAWFKTGPRGVGAHALYLNFDPGTGEFFMSLFVCPTFATCPDPLTTAPTVPEPPTGQPFTLQRIR